MGDVWKLLHILVAFWFVAGLIGRGVTIAQARRETDVGRIRALMTTAGRFERLMVIPGSAGVLVLGLLTVWAQGRSLVGEGDRWLLASLVIYLAMFALVPTVLLPRGKVFDAALEDATTAGTLTPELTAAFADRGVALARWTELIGVAVVIVLMVLKPF